MALYEEDVENEEEMDQHEIDCLKSQRDFERKFPLLKEEYFITTDKNVNIANHNFSVKTWLHSYTRIVESDNVEKHCLDKSLAAQRIKDEIRKHYGVQDKEAFEKILLSKLGLE